MYSPLTQTNGSSFIRNEPINDENGLDGTLNFQQTSPANLNSLNIPKHSSTHLNMNQNVTPKQMGLSGLKQTFVKSPLTENHNLQQMEIEDGSNILSTKASVESEFQSNQKNTLLPLDMIKEIVKDLIDDFRDDLMSECFKFKAEMFKEFIELKV